MISSRKFNNTLIIKPGFSWWLFLVFTVAHMTCLLAVFFIANDLSLYALFLVPVVAAAYTNSLNVHVFRSAKNAVSVVRHSSVAGWSIEVSGKEQEVKILGGGYVSNLLLVMRFSLQGKLLARSVIIAKDALGSDDFRHLCVKLRTSSGLPQAERV